MSKPPKVARPVAAPFALGHASGADWRKASRAATRQLGELPAGANLGFVYVTQEAGAELGAIVQNLKLETGIEHWVGAAGIGICATGSACQPACSGNCGSSSLGLAWMVMTVS